MWAYYTKLDGVSTNIQDYRSRIKYDTNTFKYCQIKLLRWMYIYYFRLDDKRSLIFFSPVNKPENSNEDVPRVYLGSRYRDDWLVP